MPHSIMLVDDDETLLSLMSLVIKKAGYVVHLASSGDEALELVETTVPDLFIIDMMLPGISGYELCKQLRANPQTADRPIFVLSSVSDEESVNEGLQAGVNRYLVKPMPSEVIVAYIKEALSG